ncbi:MAG: hypothetical protein IAG13_24000 [Deltaproteobacteria bacterium]|nr:hypothetical protein [Nannocystaceae bacterium]
MLLVLVPSLAACPGWFETGDDGPSGIDMGGEFELDPSCELDGELTVEIGDGTNGFKALVGNAGPIVHHGSQGGTHMWVGARIGGLALDRYDVVRVGIGAFDPLQCEPVGEPCKGRPLWFDGEWVLGDVVPLEPVDEHTIEQDRLTALFDIHGQALVLELGAADPCGQTGFDQLRHIPE